MLAGLAFIRSRPGKPNQRKHQNEKFMNFAHFCEFWCLSSGKQARFTLNFCSGMPLRKVHELTFLWFGLPGPLLNFVRCCHNTPGLLFRVSAGVTRGGQQQFTTQTLRVHLLGIEISGRDNESQRGAVELLRIVETESSYRPRKKKSLL